MATDQIDGTGRAGATEGEDMDRTLKIVGVIALVIIAVIVIGNVIGFLVKSLFWVAVVAAGAFAATYVIARAKDRGQLRR